MPVAHLEGFVLKSGVIGSFCLSLLAAQFIWGCSSSPTSSHTTSLHLPNGLSLQYAGRKITVDGGELRFKSGRTLKIAPAVIEIPPCEDKHISAEPIVLSTAKPGDYAFWERTPLGTKVCGLALPDVLVPGSLKVSYAGSGAPGKALNPAEYTMNAQWGAVILKPEANGAEKKVDALVDYSVKQRRFCTLAVDKQGQVRLVSGGLFHGNPSPPDVPEGLSPIANVYAPAETQPLKESDIMGFDDVAKFSPWRNSPAIERARKKLKSGGEFYIAFVGDSVTCGSCSSTPRRAFPQRFIELLRARMPNCHVNYDIYGQGGSQSVKQIPVYYKNCKRTPDLVIVEFTNDLGLNEQQIRTTYEEFMAYAHKNSIDVIVCLPHFISPTMFGALPGDWQSIVNKPYYATIKKMAVEQGFSCADVLARTRNITDEGLLPEYLLADGMIHPNDTGHKQYVEELAELLAGP